MSAEEFKERLRRLRREQAASEEPAQPSPEVGRGAPEDLLGFETARPSASLEARQKASPDASSETGASEREARPERRALPVWMAAKLRARARRARANESASGSPAPPLESLHPASSEPLRDLVDAENRFGSFRERVTRFSVEHVHGAMRLDEVEGVETRAFELFTGDALLRDWNAAGGVYLDTETTGLSGGAGTYVFQVGLGRLIDHGTAFELWQGFMEGPEEEAALLEETARRVAESTGVISFFGKSFDRHRLEDKMRLHSIEPPFAQLPHLDLYHPLRRIFRGRFQDGKLRTMERELCGLDRPDDLPGAFAPAAWFDYIAGRAHRLEGVFRHNADDVLSLVTLTAWLGKTWRAQPSESPALSIARARAFSERKDWAACLRHAEHAMEVAAKEEDRLLARRLRALAQSRQKNWRAALDDWRAVGESSLGGFDDQIEAAKCCERLSRMEAALAHCQGAKQRGAAPSALRALDSRMARIERVLAAEGKRAITPAKDS